MHFIEIGKIVRPHGYKGDCFATSLSGAESALSYLKSVYIGNSTDRLLKMTLLKASWMPKGWKLTLEGISTEEAAEGLRDTFIFAERNQLKTLPENEFYIADLQGMSGIDSRSGESVGTFLYAEEITATQSRWWFRDKAGTEFSIPAIRKYIGNVDSKTKTILLHHLEDFDGEE